MLDPVQSMGIHYICNQISFLTNRSMLPGNGEVHALYVYNLDSKMGFMVIVGYLGRRRMGILEFERFSGRL